MKRRCIAILLLTTAVTGLRAQTVPTESPKQVIEAFWKIETAGGRLTDEGWRAADHFFVKPIEPPHARVIYVIDSDYAVWDPTVRDSTAEVTIGVGGLIWKIDPRMHTTVFLNQVKGAVVYKLVLVSKHWEFAPDHRTLAEVSTAPQWRIQEADGAVWLTVDTAIRYLNQKRDNSTDPLIKKNAEQSLAMLRRHH